MAVGLMRAARSAHLVATSAWRWLAARAVQRGGALSGQHAGGSYARRREDLDGGGRRAQSCGGSCVTE
jgi:hypothetical protein